jgi:hypothetical protein
MDGWTTESVRDCVWNNNLCMEYGARFKKGETENKENKENKIVAIHRVSCQAREHNIKVVLQSASFSLSSKSISWRQGRTDTERSKINYKDLQANCNHHDTHIIEINPERLLEGPTVCGVHVRSDFGQTRR